MENKQIVGTGGELLMHQLVAQGVKYAFTNTGSAEAGFFNAFLTVPGVQPILLLAESLVLSAADGYAKAANTPAFVNVHLAAGTRQGSGQLQNAYFDGTPMVVTAAMRDTGSFGDHNTLGSSAGFSQMGAVQDITKARWEVSDPRGVPMATRRAFKHAMTMPTGPVYLAFSGPALDTEAQGTIRSGEALQVAQTPESSTLEQIHDALLNAERPLLLAGPDVRAAGAQAELLELAEHYALPAAVSFYDYGAFPLRHPSYAGLLDTMDDSKHDVVVCVGYRQNTRAQPADEKFSGAHTIIGLGHDAAMMGNTFALDLHILGDVRHSLTALNALWKPDHANLARIQKRKLELVAQSTERLAAERAQSTELSTSNPIHPLYLGDSMGRILAENTLLVSENFRGADHVMPFGYGDNDWAMVRTAGGSLGYGLGAAIGAQLAAPERPVVLSIGDGGVMYSASGFWTMARYSLPILTVVWNNMGYQTVRTNFASWGGEMKAQNKYPETFLGEPAIDYVMLAKAQGIDGMHVHSPQELDAAMTRGKEAQAAGEPFVLDVHITNVGEGADSSWHKVFALHT
jgi:benzoylformate decarboxylase